MRTKTAFWIRAPEEENATAAVRDLEAIDASNKWKRPAPASDGVERVHLTVVVCGHDRAARRAVVDVHD